jgi:hypothetical protein
MPQLHAVIKQSQTQFDHCPWKNQTYLFNGWDQNLKRDKTLFSDRILKVC